MKLMDIYDMESDMFIDEIRELNDRDDLFNLLIISCKHNNTTYAKIIAERLIEYLEDNEGLSFLPPDNSTKDDIRSCFGFVKDDGIMNILDNYFSIYTDRESYVDVMINAVLTNNIDLFMTIENMIMVVYSDYVSMLKYAGHGTDIQEFILRRISYTNTYVGRFVDIIARGIRYI